MGVLSWVRAHKLVTAAVVVGALAAAGKVDSGGAPSTTRTSDASRHQVVATATAPPASRRTRQPQQQPTPRQHTEKATPPPTSRATPPARHRLRLYPVLDVVDGDTVKVGYRGETTLRIIGIDTPETVSPTVPVECWGPQASAAAHRLLDGRQVGLVFDASQGRLDKYGRTLAYVQIPHRGDFGLIMVRRGNAAEYTYDTAYHRQASYRAAEHTARQAGRGLWGACGGPDTPLQKPTPTPAPQQATGGSCEPGYQPCLPVVSTSTAPTSPTPRSR